MCFQPRHTSLIMSAKKSMPAFILLAFESKFILTADIDAFISPEPVLI